jgi:hypothetical protein
MKSLVTAARWTTAALTAAALIGLAGGAAQAAAPVAGTEATIDLAGHFAVPVVSADGSRAYVASSDAGRNARVQVVDTVSDQVIATVALGTDQWTSYSAALSADGSLLYVANGPTLYVVDAVHATLLASVGLPDQPRPAGWTPGPVESIAVNGSSVYVEQDGPETYRQYGQGRVLVFDTAQRVFTGSVQLPATSLRSIVVRPGGQNTYVSTDTGVVHLNSATAVPSVVGTVPGTAVVNPGALALTADGAALYAVSGSGSTGAQVDLNHDTVSANLTFATGYASLSNAVVSPDGTRLFVLKQDYSNGPTLLAFSTATNKAVPADNITGFDVTNATGLALGPDGGTVYLTGDTATNSTDLQIMAY